MYIDIEDFKYSIQFNSNQTFSFQYAICTKMERSGTIHHGVMLGETDRSCEVDKLTPLIREKQLCTLIGDWKPIVIFLTKMKEK